MNSPATQNGYIQMLTHSMNCFATDGHINESELQAMVDLAKREGEVNKDELRVLMNVIRRLKPEELSEQMRTRILSLKEELGL